MIDSIPCGRAIYKMRDAQRRNEDFDSYETKDRRYHVVVSVYVREQRNGISSEVVDWH
jgi:hypothetical protein